MISRPFIAYATHVIQSWNGDQVSEITHDSNLRISWYRVHKNNQVMEYKHQSEGGFGVAYPVQFSPKPEEKKEEEKPDAQLETPSY